MKPYSWKNGNRDTRNNLSDWIIQYQTMGGGHLPVVVGMKDSRVNRWMSEGTDFLYGDHAYFDRGWDKHNFRITRNRTHLTHVVKRPDDRLKRWNVQIEPWRHGRSVVVIPPSDLVASLYGALDWLETTLKRLRSLTDRPIHVKATKGRLREMLLDEADAHAVVCFVSVAGMEAALMGVPVFTSKDCCAWPVNAGPLEKIESPEYVDRHDWACSLAYASWNADELSAIDWRDYQYSVKESTCA